VSLRPLSLCGERLLFDWLVVGQIMPVNPASSLRGSKHVVKKGKTSACYFFPFRELTLYNNFSHHW
jgi:hypothetical protein